MKDKIKKAIFTKEIHETMIPYKKIKVGEIDYINTGKMKWIFVVGKKTFSERDLYNNKMRRLTMYQYVIMPPPKDPKELDDYNQFYFTEEEIKDLLLARDTMNKLKGT